MHAHFPAVEWDNVIWFSTLSRMSGFLWHSSKWALQFVCFLQFISEIKVLACSLDTDLNYVATMLQLHLSLNYYVFGCILKDRYHLTPALSWTRGPLLFSGKICKFLRCRADILWLLSFYVVIIFWLIYYLLHS